MVAVKATVFTLLMASASMASAQLSVADAAMYGDTAAVTELIRQGSDINVSQADGATALHWASYHGDAVMAQALLAAGAEPGAMNRNGSTPMWLAASRGDAALVKVLLEGGADANEILPLGRRPLMLAARSGNIEAVELLLDHGAEPNAREEERGTTALMQAADQGHADVISLLIGRGADYAMGSAPVTRDGRTAALGNSEDPRESVRRQVINTICESDAPDLAVLRELVSESSETVWVSLASTGNEFGVEDVCSRIRRSGLGFVSTTSGTVDAGAEAQFGSGVERDVAESQAEETGSRRRFARREADGGELTPMIYAARTGSIEAVQALIDAGADINQTSRYGWSPLLAATQNRNYVMGKFLIDHGADVNLANKGGWTPLYLATDNRNLEGGDYPTRAPDMDHLAFIRLLLEQGADPNARMLESTETRTVFTNQWLNEEGATAFLRASQSGDLPLMKMLVEFGADPFINTDLGVTPLSVAAGIGWVEGVTSEWSTAQTVEAVKFLLELGVDPNAQANTGRVALHGAAHKGATEVVKVLVDAGARMDVRDFGNTDNRGSPELAAHTWLPIDYADGLVRVGVQSAIAHPETAAVLRDLMLQAGLEPPPEGRTIESICIVEVCSPNYDPVELH